MAKLGTATEIETAKQILADAVEKGETYAESWQTLKDSLGGNPSFKPGYWETVFRTNTQSAYTAGKLQKYEGTGAVAYQLLVIEDERTSKICRHLLVESGYGAILPVGHRFWQKYGFPPYHFNCRTSVCPIYSSQVAKTGYIVEDVPMNRFAKFKPQKGFGGNPLDRGSFWDMTDSMKKQAVKFGLMDLFLSERETIEQNWKTGRSVGAMAKRFYVDKTKSVKVNEIPNWIIKENTEVTGVKVIAEGTEIREVQRLIQQYPLENGNLTPAKDWYKVRGTAILLNTKTKRELKAEIHWYQCKNIGKVEFKFKREIK